MKGLYLLDIRFFVLFFSFRVCYFLLTIVRLQKYSTKIDRTLKKVFNIKRVYKLSKDYLLIPFCYSYKLALE